ncbi:protein TOPLESS [Senna tora]|uniref:Protein TOPLESS n=1 Tax=Senna tora TaxID=362788 RepID=A0A834W6W3_9FABA|nr:protein TOPLESS [Senna tora]KAF7811419.1 protein TOPLESS [Senna tora]
MPRQKHPAKSSSYATQVHTTKKMSKSLPFEVVMLKSLLACFRSSEVEAHDGNVNVIAFSTVNKQFFVITCGDDKIVKVWDVTSGDKCYTFDGQDAPVCSICPHKKEQVNCQLRSFPELFPLGRYPTSEKIPAIITL